MKCLVIGITGRDTEGAALIADHYKREHGFEIATFLAPFEEALAAILNMDVSAIRTHAAAGDDLFEELPPAPGQYEERNPTVRSAIMALRGSFAHNQHEQFNAALMKRRLDQLAHFLEPLPGIVVPDVLMRSEADFIRSLGGAMFHVRNTFVDRGTRNDFHDPLLSPLAIDHTIENNGTAADLFMRADDLLARLQGFSGTATYSGRSA